MGDLDQEPVRMSHAEAVRSLPAHHRDPFDRMLVAQARVEDLALVSRIRRCARMTCGCFGAETFHRPCSALVEAAHGLRRLTAFRSLQRQRGVAPLTTAALRLQALSELALPPTAGAQ